MDAGALVARAECGGPGHRQLRLDLAPEAIEALRLADVAPGLRREPSAHGRPASQRLLVLAGLLGQFGKVRVQLQHEREAGEQVAEDGLRVALEVLPASRRQQSEVGAPALRIRDGTVRPQPRRLAPVLPPLRREGESLNLVDVLCRHEAPPVRPPITQMHPAVSTKAPEWRDRVQPCAVANAVRQSRTQSAGSNGPAMPVPV